MHNPRNAQYLAVVSEWESYGHSGGKLGNAYPIFSLTHDGVVDDPQGTFPNPGYVFLLNRGEREAWDFVIVRPQENPRWHGESIREAALLSHDTPNLFSTSASTRRVATILEDASFDCESRQIKNPVQNVTPIFFVRTSEGTVVGPLRWLGTSMKTYGVLDSIRWEPYRVDAVVFEFTYESLKEKGLRIEVYQHPTPDLNDVIRNPFTLIVGDVASLESDKSLDLLPDSKLADWYAKYKDLPSNEFGALADALRSDLEHAGSLPSPVIRNRIERVFSSVMKLELFEAERRAITKRYLATEEGQKRLHEQLDLEVKRRAATIDDKVKELRTELANEQEQLQKEIEQSRANHEQTVKDMKQQLAELEQTRSDLQASVTTLENKIADGVEGLAKQVNENVPLLAAITRGLHKPSRGSGVADVGTGDTSPETWSRVVPCAPSKDLGEWVNESDIVTMIAEDLAAAGLNFTRDFLANIYVCLKASPLNLISGPPGHGKSSLVSRLAHAIGHGNALLEIPVRRTWSDDRYLLGFYDSFHGKYDPGQTGLATRLVQAQADWDCAGNGVYVVLLDEFNLAAPEYYFSQLLQVVPRLGTERRVRLFDPAGKTAEVKGLSELRLYDNVSFWGTINYDETTERLSPRLLDRTGVVFLHSRDVSPSVISDEVRTVPNCGVRADQLFNVFRKQAKDCPEDSWEKIEPVLQVLSQEKAAWGFGFEMSPRLIEGIRCYMANAHGLLEPALAADFAFQQRVLPVLRGRGSGFKERVKAIGEALEQGGLSRSAHHISAALSNADVNFDDVDFLAY